MSYPDPNNPYAQPPQGQSYGYPQQPPAQPGYGSPQAPAGYPGAAPQTMPGLMVTARVFLYIIGGFQILAGLALAIAAASVDDISKAADEAAGSGADNPFAAFSGLASGAFLVIGLLVLGFAALSITLAVKFSKGGQGIRITTLVYGALGVLVGLLNLVQGVNAGAPAALLGALLWLVFGGIIVAAMVTKSGTAWFNRPRY
jgi:hypothetical protein